jgi:hypothetical protein
MKNKCPSWRGNAPVRLRRQGRRVVAFTGAERKPLTEGADGSGAGFSQEGQCEKNLHATLRTRENGLNLREWMGV